MGVLTAQAEQQEAVINQWKAVDAQRLAVLEDVLSRQAFCPEEREEAARLDETILAGGYDAGAHEAARKAELAARASETEFHSLEKARAAIEGLRRELKTLQASKSDYEEEISSRTIESTSLQRALALKEKRCLICQRFSRSSTGRRKKKTGSGLKPAAPSREWMCWKCSANAKPIMKRRSKTSTAR